MDVQPTNVCDVIKNERHEESEELASVPFISKARLCK